MRTDVYAKLPQHLRWGQIEFSGAHPANRICRLRLLKPNQGVLSRIMDGVEGDIALLRFNVTLQMNRSCLRVQRLYHHKESLTS